MRNSIRLQSKGLAKLARPISRVTPVGALAIISSRIEYRGWPQRVLKKLPRELAARILVAAIARHAWTFAGGGAFSYEFSPQLTLRLMGSPICKGLRTQEPACTYFAATFERVFREMLGPSFACTKSTAKRPARRPASSRFSGKSRDYLAGTSQSSAGE